MTSTCDSEAGEVGGARWWKVKHCESEVGLGMDEDDDDDSDDDEYLHCKILSSLNSYEQTEVKSFR